MVCLQPTLRRYQDELPSTPFAAKRGRFGSDVLFFLCNRSTATLRSLLAFFHVPPLYPIDCICVDGRAGNIQSQRGCHYRLYRYCSDSKAWIWNISTSDARGFGGGSSGCTGNGNHSPYVFFGAGDPNRVLLHDFFNSDFGGSFILVVAVAFA